MAHIYTIHSHPIGRTHLFELLAQTLAPRLLGVQQLARVHQHHLEVARRRPVCPPPTPTQREREEGGARSDHSVRIEAMQSHPACMLVTATRPLPCTYVSSTSSPNSFSSSAARFCWCLCQRRERKSKQGSSQREEGGRQAARETVSGYALCPWRGVVLYMSRVSDIC